MFRNALALEMDVQHPGFIVVCFFLGDSPGRYSSGIVVCFLLGDSPVSEFHMPTLRNTLSHFHRQAGMKYNNPGYYSSYLPTYEDGRDRVFRNVGI